jgi:D-alanyl-D-alanine carboxypeptidase
VSRAARHAAGSRAGTSSTAIPAAKGKAQGGHRKRRRSVVVARRSRNILVPNLVGLVALVGAAGGTVVDSKPNPVESQLSEGRHTLDASVLSRTSNAVVSRSSIRAKAAIPLADIPIPAGASLPPPDPTPYGFPSVPGCDAKIDESPTNGQVGTDHLCPIGGGEMLRPDAAAAFMALNAAYQQRFGVPLQITDAYRTLREQSILRRQKPGLAARPGTSEHGFGLAVDLGGGIESYYTTQHKWMRTHAPDFGFDLPKWARDGNGREEPWHWEYTPVY